MLKFHSFIVLTCEELVLCEDLVAIFHKCEESVPNPHTCEGSVQNPQICEKLVSKHHMCKIGIKTHTCEEMVPKPHTCENCYQFITHMKNWYLIVTDVSDKTVKNWNRM